MSKWLITYSNLTVVQAEKRLGFQIRPVKTISVERMLANAKHSLGEECSDAILKTKERVYDNVPEYLGIEGYLPEGGPDFKGASVNHLVYAAIRPMLGNFKHMSGLTDRLIDLFSFFRSVIS